MGTGNFNVVLAKQQNPNIDLGVTLLPGLESPSVIPLAHEGMIAIHSVVGADDVWGLLPKLKAAGADPERAASCASSCEAARAWT